MPSQSEFLVEYHGQGSTRGRSTDPECAHLMSGDDASMDECHVQFGCKCQDTRNNTYTCIRKKMQTEDSIYCVFQVH